MSTKIYVMCTNSRSGAATRVARDWRVVIMIPDDIKQSLDVLGLYKGISSHSFEDMEPFVPMMDSSNLTKAQVRKAQAAQDFQDIPLSVKVADDLDHWECISSSMWMLVSVLVRRLSLLLVYPLEHLETTQRRSKGTVFYNSNFIMLLFSVFTV